MKTKSIFFILMLFSSMTTFAQHPLVGTWEMVSIKGTDIEGKPLGSANLRITKIITPTHYMVIEHTVRNDSLIFRSASAGTIQLEDNKYSHTSTLSSGATTGTKSEYTWKIKGNQLIQTGTITKPDGKKSVLDEVVFKRVGSSGANSKTPIVGTWNQLSSEYTSYDGTKGLDTPNTATKFWLITPTHWMQMAHRDSKFVYVQSGSYIIENDKVIPTATVASFPVNNKTKYNITYRVDENKLYLTGSATREDGKKMTWVDVLEKASGK